MDNELDQEMLQIYGEIYGDNSRCFISNITTEVVSKIKLCAPSQLVTMLRLSYTSFVTYTIQLVTFYSAESILKQILGESALRSKNRTQRYLNTSKNWT